MSELSSQPIKKPPVPFSFGGALSQPQLNAADIPPIGNGTSKAAAVFPHL